MTASPPLRYTIRKWYTIVDESQYRNPVKRVVVAAAIKNPYAATTADTLENIFCDLPQLGQEFGERLLGALAPFKPHAYGKAALVGSLGEFEHGKAFLTTDMVNSIRTLFDNAQAWVPSTCKRACIQDSITIPLADKDVLDMQNDRDAITVSFPEAPRPDEVVVIFAASNARLQPAFEASKRNDPK